MSASEPTGFRRWRRSRPFWGGLFAIAAGLEIVSIPLAPTGLMLKQGIAGVPGSLVGVLMILTGLGMWFQPKQRVFYGVVTVLLALVSFVTSTLGGFLIGMLLGIVGGALSAAWAPLPSSPPDDPLDDLPDRPESPASRTYAIALLPILVGASMMTGTSHGTQTTCTWLTQLLGCQATPRATTPRTAPAAPSTPGQPAKKSCPAAKPTAGMSPQDIVRAIAAAAPCAKPGKARTVDGQPPVTIDVATLHASSLTMDGLHYDGIVDLPTAHGTEEALRFSMKRAVLNGVDQRFGNGHQARLRARTLTFDDGVVMYATKMTSNPLGLPLTLTFTPQRPPPGAILSLLPTLFMTNVVTAQSEVFAGTLDATALNLSA